MPLMAKVLENLQCMTWDHGGILSRAAVLILEIIFVQ